jgi:hypothetical protein
LDYSEEQYVIRDDRYSGDYEGEESTWTNTNSTSGSEVWLDTRTGLYWSGSLPNTYTTNGFSSPSSGLCGFFNTGTYPTRGDYGTSGTDPDCGNSINPCAVLSLASKQGETADTDWYLPSQKEAHRAYVNGMYNQTSSAFASIRLYWTSTQSSDDIAYYQLFATGRMEVNYKTGDAFVRCVRRD